MRYNEQKQIMLEARTKSRQSLIISPFQLFPKSVLTNALQNLVIFKLNNLLLKNNFKAPPLTKVTNNVYPNAWLGF